MMKSHMGRRWRGAIGLALSIFAITSAGALPVSAAQGNQGLQDGWAIGDQGQITGGQLLSDELGFMQSAGAGWVRINFRLGQCFTDWSPQSVCRYTGQTALQAYDQVLAKVQANNLKVLGLLTAESWKGDQTAWTAGNAENVTGGTGTNAYIQAFAQDAAGVLAAHYNGVNGPLVSQWEVWTEPNAWTDNPSPGVYTGSSFIYPSNFAQMLSQASKAVKNANSTALVVSGGLLGLDSGATNKGARNGYRAKGGGHNCPSNLPSGGDYLCSTYDMGRKYAGWVTGQSPFGAVGQHLYIDQGSATSASNITNYLGDLRKAYENYGGEPRAEQTHVTEFGWTTAGVSPVVQASNLQTAYQAFKSAGYVGRGYWYRTQDLGAANDYFGLLTTNGATKLAFTSYQQYANF